MRQTLVTSLALVLIIASMANPAEANSSSVAATTFAYRHSDQSTISVLVESFGDIGIGESRSLSGFGTVTTVAGPVAVVHTLRQELPSIARLHFISSIEQSWPLHVYLDKSVPDIGANTVWEQVRDSQNRNVTGSGVVIGFVDTGIDVSHPDFTFPNGTTKILYVWDQTISGRTPSGFDYGYECDGNDIHNGRCAETDTFGHGTHVAGIATSSGRATGNYTGVAPDASIIFVKSGNEMCGGNGWTFDSAEILDGVNYIVTKARQLGRRAVINLSLGGNIGGHDGSDPLEMALDRFVESGTPIVVAAGNQGQDNAHIQGRLAKDTNVRFDIAVSETTTDLAIDVWYSPQDELDATLTTPSGKTYTALASTGGTSANYGNVTTLGKSTNLGNELYFEVNSNISLPTRGWSVTLGAHNVISNGIWNAWVDTGSCASPGASFLPGTEYSIDQNDTIGIPGTAHYVLTVGAYATKTFWKGANNRFYGFNSSAPGEIGSYSSRGPTRDGRVKPDVTAPGSVIASARSMAIPEKPSDPDMFHRMLSGTSMAAPHVTGTIALMLQYSPSLQAVGLSRIIQDTARQDPYTGLLPSGSPIWGFGKIDARTATGLHRLTVIVDGLPSDTNVDFHFDTAAYNATSSSWLDLYFPLSTNHTVRFDALIKIEEGIQFQITHAKLIIGTKTVDITNFVVKASLVYAGIIDTGFLLVSYEPIRASSANPLPLALSSIALLVLLILVSSLCFLLYLIRRRRVSRRTR